MTTRHASKSTQDDVMTIANLYKGNIHNVNGRMVTFSFSCGDDRVGFQNHLQEIRVSGIKLIKDDHGLKLGIEFLQ